MQQHPRSSAPRGPDLEATTTPSLPIPASPRPEETLAPPASELVATVASRPAALGDPERTTASMPETGPPTAAQPDRLGRYVIVKQLGAGAMGVVYKAFDPDLDRKVAIKLLRGPAFADARSRLLREAQAMAKLSHPNVVPVFDVGVHDEQVFIAMDFIDGSDLRAWLATPRPWREVVEVFAQAGAGLAAAHAVGLVHRDFKPDNVLLSTDPATGRLRAQVADFGLARRGDDGPDAPAQSQPGGGSVLEAPLTHYGTIVGTPAYMSPEQHAALAVDARTDQYSFCVALFEALYGKRPYSGSTLDELARRSRERTREPPPPGSEVPGWLYRLCTRGLHPDREDRFPKMEALLAELQAGRARGRRRALALGGVAFAAAIAGGTAWAVSGPGVCEGGPERVAAVWSPARRAAAEQAFAATGLPYAEGAWTGAAGLLDEYGGAWAGMYADACAATQIRGEQSAELMDLRMTCLQRRLSDMDALLTLFEGADRQIVKRAAEAAVALPDLRACADAEALRNGALAPRPTVDPAAVEALRERLRAARAQTSAGKAKDAVPALEGIVAEAAALAEPSLTAAARLALARAQAATGADEAAAASAASAAWQAIADRDDETLWEAIGHAIVVVGYKLGRKAEAAPWIEHARALLRRRGDPPELRATLLGHVGMVEIAAGDPAAADAPLVEALALRERAFGANHPRLVGTLNTLGAARLRAGRYADAQALLERAVAVAEASGGPGHPDLAHPLNNLALALERQNRHDDAIAALRRSHAILAAINPDDPNLGLIRQNIGGMLHLSGRSADAKPELAAALAHLERTIGPEHPGVAGALSFSGDVDRALGDLPGARAAYSRACAIREKALGASHPDLALCLLGLGEVDLAEGRPADALGRLDRALANVAGAAFDPGDLGLLHFARARALRATGALDASREAATSAGEALGRAGLAGEKTLVELTRWRSEHP